MFLRAWCDTSRVGQGMGGENFEPRSWRSRCSALASSSPTCKRVRGPWCQNHVTGHLQIEGIHVRDAQETNKCRGCAALCDTFPMGQPAGAVFYNAFAHRKTPSTRLARPFPEPTGLCACRLLSRSSQRTVARATRVVFEYDCTGSLYHNTSMIASRLYCDCTVRYGS